MLDPILMPHGSYTDNCTWLQSWAVNRHGSYVKSSPLMYESCIGSEDTRTYFPRTCFYAIILHTFVQSRG
jgi:hypothetical protein